MPYYKHMNVTARAISDWALTELKKMLADNQYTHETAMYRQISVLANVSQSTVRQFHQGTQPNLSTATLDRLVAAIKTAQRLRAA